MPCLRFKSGAVMTFSSIGRMLDFVEVLGEEGRRELRRLVSPAAPVLPRVRPPQGKAEMRCPGSEGSVNDPHGYR